MGTFLTEFADPTNYCGTKKLDNAARFLREPQILCGNQNAA